MFKPNESLDDYVVKALPETTELPRHVSLRFTGEVEVLKPLARWERPVKLVPAAAAPHRLSWFHRSLVMGGGVAVAALVLASAMIIGVSDAARESETAQVDFVEVSETAAVEQSPAAVEEPLSADIFTSTHSQRTARTGTFRNRKYRANRVSLGYSDSHFRTRARKTVVRRHKEPHQSLVSRFVPTTLVIYIENGLIKSRIEPWLSDRR